MLRLELLKDYCMDDWICNLFHSLSSYPQGRERQSKLLCHSGNGRWSMWNVFEPDLTCALYCSAFCSFNARFVVLSKCLTLIWTNFFHTHRQRWLSNLNMSTSKWQTWPRLNLAFRWGKKTESRSWFINSLSNFAANIGFRSFLCMLHVDVPWSVHFWFPTVCQIVEWTCMTWLVLDSSFQFLGSLRQRDGHGAGSFRDGG